MFLKPEEFKRLPPLFQEIITAHDELTKALSKRVVDLADANALAQHLKGLTTAAARQYGHSIRGDRTA